MRRQSPAAWSQPVCGHLLGQSWGTNAQHLPTDTSKGLPETKPVSLLLEILGPDHLRSQFTSQAPEALDWRTQTQPLGILVAAGLGKLKNRQTLLEARKGREGSHALNAMGARPCLDHSPWRMLPPALGLVAWRPPLGSDLVAIAPNTRHGAQARTPPEIVAWGYVVGCVPGVQAAEGIPGQAEGGGPVQVAVPLDLDAHDAPLVGCEQSPF